MPDRESHHWWRVETEHYCTPPLLCRTYRWALLRIEPGERDSGGLSERNSSTHIKYHWWPLPQHIAVSYHTNTRKGVTPLYIRTVTIFYSQYDGRRGWSNSSSITTSDFVENCRCCSERSTRSAGKAGGGAVSSSGVGSKVTRDSLTAGN